MRATDDLHIRPADASLAAAPPPPPPADDRALTLLERLSHVAHAARTGSRGVRDALQLIADFGDWPVARLYLRSARAASAIPTSLWAGAAVAGAAALPPPLPDLQRAFGIALASRVLRTGEPVRLGDGRGHPALAPLRRLEIHSALYLPVPGVGRPIGVLEFLARRPIRPDALLLRVMRVAAGHVGDLLDRGLRQRRLARLAAREERRIARELHDSVGQDAVTVGIQAHLLCRDLRRRGAPEAAAAARLEESVARVKRSIRDLVATIHAVEVAPERFRAELERIAGRYARLGRCDCRVHVGSDLEITDVIAATELVRITREAVHNAVRHGRPRRVAIRLRRGPAGDQAMLEVIDDGRGVGPPSVEADGLGQSIMRSRAESLGGRLEVGPAPPRGVRVRCTFPLASLTGSRKGEPA